MSEEPAIHPGAVAPELIEEWPGLRLAWSTFEAPGAGHGSPREVRERMRALSDRFRGPQAIELRRQAIPHAYRVFFRHIGLEPDTTRTPVEALALARMQHGGFRSGTLLEDAITLAVMETAVPVWAFDASRVEGSPELRPARPGERLGRSEEAAGVPPGRVVVADARGPLAVLFGALAPDAAVTRRTRELTLLCVAVPGVPEIHLEETLWTVWDIITA